MLYSLLNLGAAAFTEAQMTSIQSAITSAVGAMIDTFIGVLPVIALICGAIFGVRFILRQFKKLD